MDIFNSDNNRVLPSRAAFFRRELVAGMITFATMSYIICVQPAILSGSMFGFSTGMDIGALTTTTCLASAFGCILMGIWARYPFALAPGMGENFFVVLTILPLCTVCLGKEADPAHSWALAMGVVFLGGALFMILSLLGVRNILIRIISPPLRSAIGAGIGLFIAWIGLKNAGIIVVDKNAVQFGHLLSWDTAVFALGLFLSIALISRKITGAILFGIIAAALLAIFAGKITLSGWIGMPPDPSPLIGNIDIPGALSHLAVLWPMILILTFLDIFDTLGTVVGIAQRSNMMKGNSLPRAERIFISDASATLFGAFMGHSTITTFIESASGVAGGGRTGWTAIFVGIFFLIAMFFAPLLTAVAAYAPITSSALVIVGIMMMKEVRSIDWDNFSDALPCFLVISVIPFSGSIANGILLGLLVWPISKVLCGKQKEIHPLMYLLFILLLLYTIFVIK